MNSLHRLLNCENRWIRVLLHVQLSIEHMSIVYTCNTYFVMHWSMLFVRECLVIVRIQYLAMKVVSCLRKTTGAFDGSWTHDWPITIQMCNTAFTDDRTLEHVLLLDIITCDALFKYLCIYIYVHYICASSIRMLVFSDLIQTMSEHDWSNVTV